MATDPVSAPASPARSQGSLAAIKRLPRPVLYAFLGAVIAAGFVLYKRATSTPPGDTVEGPDMADTGVGSVPAEQLAGVPSPVYVQPSVPLPEPAETVGAIGQTALETLVGLIGTVIDPARTQPQVDVGAEIGEIISHLPLTPPPAPAPIQANVPTAAPTRPPGYNTGNTVAGKTFSGAVGWKEIPTPDARFNDYHIAFRDHRLERWRKHLRNHDGQRAGTWDRIWSGTWG